MKVLVACEMSGVVRDAFLERGHDAWSNDLQPNDHPNHIQGDCFKALESRKWDLIIMHPPCDHLAVSGNRWYGMGTQGYHKRVEAVKWTAALWKLAMYQGKRVALENPVSVIFPILRRDFVVQYVQPWQFGHKEKKRTGFALHNLPPLEPTDILETPLKGTPEYLEWQKVWRMAPSAERKNARSKTYEGIASAMADQWGTLDER